MSIWDKRKDVDNSELMMESLRKTRLPLDDTKSQIVCITEVGPDFINAIIISPSGIINKVEDTEIDKSFWHFAVRNYYIVTGNAKDRWQLVFMFNKSEPVSLFDSESVSNDDWKGSSVDINKVDGCYMSRAASDGLSGMKLDEMLLDLGVVTNKPQRQRTFF